MTDLSQADLLRKGREKLAAFRANKPVTPGAGAAAAAAASSPTDNSTHSTNAESTHQHQSAMNGNGNGQPANHTPNTSTYHDQLANANGHATTVDQATFSYNQTYAADVNPTSTSTSPSTVLAQQLAQLQAQWNGYMQAGYGSDPQYSQFFTQLQQQIYSVQQQLAAQSTNTTAPTQTYPEQQPQQQQQQIATSTSQPLAIDYSASPTLQSYTPEQRNAFLSFAQYYNDPNYASYYADMRNNPQYASYFQIMAQVESELQAIQQQQQQQQVSQNIQGQSTPTNDALNAPVDANGNANQPVNTDHQQQQLYEEQQRQQEAALHQQQQQEAAAAAAAAQQQMDEQNRIEREQELERERQRQLEREREIEHDQERQRQLQQQQAEEEQRRLAAEAAARDEQLRLQQQEEEQAKRDQEYQYQQQLAAQEAERQRQEAEAAERSQLAAQAEEQQRLADESTAQQFQPIHADVSQPTPYDAPILDHESHDELIDQDEVSQQSYTFVASTNTSSTQPSYQPDSSYQPSPDSYLDDSSTLNSDDSPSRSSSVSAAAELPSTVSVYDDANRSREATPALENNNAADFPSEHTSNEPTISSLAFDHQQSQRENHISTQSQQSPDQGLSDVYSLLQGQSQSSSQSDPAALQLQALSSTIQTLSTEVDSLRLEKDKYAHHHHVLQQQLNEKNQRIEQISQDNIAILIEMEQMEQELSRFQEDSRNQLKLLPATPSPQSAATPPCTHGPALYELHELHLQITQSWKRNQQLTTEIDETLAELKQLSDSTNESQAASPLLLTDGQSATILSGVSATPDVHSTTVAPIHRERSNSDPNVSVLSETTNTSSSSSSSTIEPEYSASQLSTPQKRQQQLVPTASSATTVSAVLSASSSLTQLLQAKREMEAHLNTLLRRASELTDPTATLIGTGESGVSKMLKAMQKKALAHAQASSPSSAPGMIVSQRPDEATLAQLNELRVARDNLALQLQSQVERANLLIRDKILLAKRIEDGFEEKELVVSTLREQIETLQKDRKAIQEKAEAYEQKLRDLNIPPPAERELTEAEQASAAYAQYDRPLSPTTAPSTVSAGTSTNAEIGVEFPPESDPTFVPMLTSPTATAIGQDIRELNQYYVESHRQQPQPPPASSVPQAAAPASAAESSSTTDSPPNRGGLFSALITFFVERFSQRGYEAALKRLQAKREAERQRRREAGEEEEDEAV